MTDIAKPNRKFSMGGVLYTVFGLWLGLNLILMLFGQVMTVIEGMKYGSLVQLIFNQIVPNTVALIKYALSTLAVAAFGVCLLLKVHSKLLAVFPAIKLVLCLWDLVAVVINFFVGIVQTFLMGGNMIQAVQSALTRNIISVAIEALVWALLIVLILVNCSKKRDAESKGKLKLLAWFLPVLVIAAFAVGIAEFGVTDLITKFVYAQLYGSGIVHISYFSAISNLLILASRFMALGAIQRIVPVIDIALWIIPTGVSALGAFFAARWIADPFNRK